MAEILDLQDLSEEDIKEANEILVERLIVEWGLLDPPVVAP